MPSIHVSHPFDLSSGVSIKNRTFKSAMSEQLGDSSHNPTPELCHLYERWAQGGIGICVTGNVMIDRTALGEPKNVVLDERSDVGLFKKWAAAGTQNNTQLWMQLNHPGKQIPNFLTKEPVAPSAISLGRGLEKAFNTPRALTHDEILAIIQAFATAARLAKSASFSGVQIHGAHGYLVSQFLSARHNQRTDEWGGNLDNRMNFVRAVYRAIRQEVGADFPVGIKLNSADFMKGGFSEEESMQVIAMLEQEGIDHIEISGGTYESPEMMGETAAQTNQLTKESTRLREAYFLDYAEKVRAKTQLALAVTGGFRSSAGMNAALQSGAVDMVGFARPLAIDPDFPNKVLADDAFKLDMKLPATFSKTVNRMTGLDIVWFEFQLRRLGEGKQPNPDLSAWKVIGNIVWTSGLLMFKQRRA